MKPLELFFGVWKKFKVQYEMLKYGCLKALSFPFVPGVMVWTLGETLLFIQQIDAICVTSASVRSLIFDLSWYFR